MNGKISAEAFHRMLEETARGLGSKKLRLEPEAVAEYCRLTGHDFERCRARDQAPAGFLLTFIDPITSEFMIKFFTAHPGTVTGIIHTFSRLELHAALPCSAADYEERIEVKKVEAKSGSKGDYLVVDFEVTLMDSASQAAAVDRHQFFCRV